MMRTDSALPNDARTERGPLPLVVGITGHRDLRDQDLPDLERVVRGVFAELSNGYPHTPICVLSAIAEGADRLAARVAIELGARLVVPLPFPREVYERDFSSEASRAEFLRLFEAADFSFDLPSVSEVRGGQQTRERAYEAAGIFIARHSHLLVALWDGVAGRGLGGTADVIQAKLDGGRLFAGELASPLDMADSGPVWHIVTPHQATPNPGGKLFEVRRYYPELRVKTVAASTNDPSRTSHGAPAAALERSHFEAFNRDAVALGPSLALSREQSAASLLPESVATELPGSLQSLRRLYATADALAVSCQRRVLSLMRDLFVLVFIGALLFTVYAHGWNHPALFIAYLVALGGAWLRWYGGHRSHYQHKHEDYRALAEGLRVQFYWRLIGLSDLVESNYLGKQRSELEWIRKAIRAGSLHVASEAPSADPRAFALVSKHWVGGQLTYFIEKAVREDRAARRCRAGSRWCLVVFGLGLLVLSILMGGDRFGYWHVAHGTHEAVLVLIAMAAVAGALVHSYGEKRAYAEHAKHSERMALIFARAAHALSQHAVGLTPDASRQLMRELGREALMENGDWVLLHRQRPVEVPEAEGLRGALPEVLR